MKKLINKAYLSRLILAGILSLFLLPSLPLKAQWYNPPVKTVKPSDFPHSFIYSDSTAFYPLSIDSLSKILRPYKVFSAIVTQDGADAPVAEVFENTLGVTVTWVYQDPTTFKAITPSAVFTEGRTFFIVGCPHDPAVSPGILIWSNSEEIILTIDSPGDLRSRPIEIRVYYDISE